MKTYCVKCRKGTKNIDPKIIKTKNNRLFMQSKCPVYVIKKSRFVKENESKGLLSTLWIKTPLSKIPLLNLKQPGFTYSACGPFTTNKERIEKFMQTGNTDFIYRN